MALGDALEPLQQVVVDALTFAVFAYGDHGDGIFAQFIHFAYTSRVVPDGNSYNSATARFQ